MRIVLAYSGGLDTSVALHWLRERYQAEVIAFCANIGQPDSMEQVERKARECGAVDVRIEDLRETYLSDYVFKALKANAAYEGRYLMAAPLGRPLIGQRLVAIAHEVGADAVAHGSTGKGTDQVRFYTTVVAHDPRMRVLAPAIEWEMRSREDEIAYATRWGIEVPVQISSPYSKDGSIWGTSTECGILEDPSQPPPPEVFQLTCSPEESPDESAVVHVGFECGVPVALDSVRLEPVSLVERLTELGGRHGIGRIDIIENSLLGIKTRAIYESPAGAILHHAHRELENLVIDRDTLHYKVQLEQKYAELVYYGLWFSPLRSALDAFMEQTQIRVSGTISLKLYKGNLTVIGREADSLLYSYSLASHDRHDSFDHVAAEGFSYVWSMPLRVEALRNP
jgi:argininosuccinate synthase